MRQFAQLGLLLALFTGGLAAQQAETCRGRVVDATGAPIPKADVAIVQQEKPAAHLTTDRDGNFSFSGSPGEYQVTVSSQGFRPIRKVSPFAKDSTTSIMMTIGGGSSVTPHKFPVTAVAAAPVPATIDPLPNVPPRSVASNFAAARVAVGNPLRGDVAAWNFGVLGQGGVGLTEERGNFRFFMLGVHGGKVLTQTVGHGLLRGNFEYGVEVFPLWQSYTPVMQRQNCVPLAAGGAAVRCSGYFNTGGTYTGLSVTPAILRWNFAGWGRLSPWMQGAGGVIWTNHKYPGFGGPPSYPPGTVVLNPGGTTSYNSLSANTSVWNFTPQFGVGAHYFLRPRRSLDLGANAIHISSASLGDRNPGVNASVQFTLGYSWWK